MSMDLEHKLTEYYISNAAKIGDGFPVWLNAARREAIDNMNLCTLPDSTDERYRHTNVRELFAEEWTCCFDRTQAHCAAADAVTDVPVAEIPIDGYKVEVRNGFVKDRTVEVLDNGIVYGSLAAAVVDFEELFKSNFDKIADIRVDAVSALNTAFMQDGAFVYVPKDVVAEKPFVLDYYYGAAQGKMLSFARTLIIIEDGAKAEVVVSQRGSATDRLVINYVREVALAAGASLKVSEFCSMDDHSAIVVSSSIAQAEYSKSESVLATMGGSASRIDYKVDLKGAGADANVYGLYLISGEQCADINIDMNHLVADCTSNEVVKGVAAGVAVGSFTGRIYVAPNAQRTSALQQSRNLLLGGSARIYTKPQLEIYADDVKCSHGATVGQLDDDAIYYMRQRGISQEDARRLQMSGFVNDIISKLPTERLAAYVYSQVATKIDSL